LTVVSPAATAVGHEEIWASGVQGGRRGANVISGCDIGVDSTDALYDPVRDENTEWTLEQSAWLLIVHVGIGIQLIDTSDRVTPGYVTVT
jgi:hypothetical protein